MQNKLSYREAKIEDVPQIQKVRNLVKENTLSNPALVTDADCVAYITKRGKGWVCENEADIVGFAIADLQDNNIWALFILPNFEKIGIGQRLHKLMLDWYFLQTTTSVWLATEIATRAVNFYSKAGWVAVGTYGVNEIKFEMTYDMWQKLQNK